MLEQLGIGERSFASSYRTGQNKTVRLLNLPKRECLILVSGFSVEMRALERFRPWRDQVVKLAVAQLS